MSMTIKVIKRAEKDGRITGVFDYGSLGGIREVTVDLGTVRTAKNYDEHADRITSLLATETKISALKNSSMN